MDYKELVDRLNEWNENLISELCADDILTCDDLCGCTGDCIVVQAATAITDLLARAEAAEARAEKAERERDEYFKHLQGFCFCCAHRTDGFDCHAKCYGHKRGSAWVYAGPKKED